MRGMKKPKEKSCAVPTAFNHHLIATAEDGRGGVLFAMTE